MSGKFGVSQSVKRVEDQRLLTGAGRYLDDQRWPKEARAYFLRSSVASGAIAGVDVTAAREASGVIAVYTAADLAADGLSDVSTGRGSMADGSAGPQKGRPLLAADHVRHVGDAVVMIVAETLAAARDAAELIELDIADREPVVDLAAAILPDAALVHDDAPGNLALDEGYGADAATVEAALSAAAHVVTLDLVNNRVVSNPMETRGALAAWDGARLTLETGAQGVWEIKDEVARQLGLDKAAVHVVTQDVGGGFGTKGVVYPEQIAVSYAAKKLGRPVKWVADRSEGFLSDAMGRDHLTTMTAGFDADLKLVALRADCLAGMGAYLSPYAVWIPSDCAAKVLTGVYDVQAARLNVKGVFTNTTPVDAYRGAGRPEAIYAIERLMDHAARQFGVDPIELRKKSYIPISAMPYRSATGELYDTGDFVRVTDAAAAKADLAGFPERRAASARAGKLRGVGLCYYIESILGDPAETAKVEITADGFAEIYVGVQSNGQGHETVFPQFLHTKTGLPFDRIRVVMGDSDRIKTGGGTGGSRSVTTQGVAINAAGDALIERMKPLAEEELEVSAADIEFRDGAYHVAGTDKRVDMLTLAARAHRSGRAELAMAEERTALPGRSYPNGCHIAEVEIDPDTGRLSLERYVMVDDFGVLINPMLAEGQAQGGVVQGLGQAVMEFVAYDESGQLQTGSFMDYAMPRAADAPWLEFYEEPTPSTANPIGMKGCGEAGTVGALAAITNAGLDALWPAGVRHVDMPLTPSRVWGWLQAAQGAERVAAE